MTDRFVVIGNPIAHSMSPAIHGDFAHQLGLDIQYHRWYSPLQGFEQTVRALQACGVAGANVTVPFKHEAAALANQPSADVQFAGAANTLKFVNGPKGESLVEAYNTDGLGLCRDLTRLLAQQGLKLNQVHVMMLGAGGAAKGCVAAFQSHGVKGLSILNRTPDKAVVLAKAAESLGLDAWGDGLDGLPNNDSAPFVLVNASSSSLNGQIPNIAPAWWKQSVLALDMMYGSKPTPFMLEAARQQTGLMVADGLGMLVFQAAHAFEIWTGQRPDADSTLERIRQTLSLKS